jgi:hypothetical protein
MKVITISVLVLFITTLLLPEVGSACFCTVGNEDFSTTYQSQDSVFIGKALETFTGPRSFSSHTLFRVSEAWKGVGTKEVFVETSLCPIQFENGKEYLVFAQGTGTKVSTSGCTLTRELSYAKDDLKVLGSPKISLKTNIIPIRVEYFIKGIFPEVVAVFAFFLLFLVTRSKFLRHHTQGNKI